MYALASIAVFILINFMFGISEFLHIFKFVFPLDFLDISALCLMLKFSTACRIDSLSFPLSPLYRIQHSGINRMQKVQFPYYSPSNSNCMHS